MPKENPKEDESKNCESCTSNAGIWLAMAISFGAVLGVVIDNIAIGVSLGVVVGIIGPVCMKACENESCTSESDQSKDSSDN
jgi:hypothetical protein